MHSLPSTEHKVETIKVTYRNIDVNDNDHSFAKHCSQTNCQKDLGSATEIMPYA